MIWKVQRLTQAQRRQVLSCWKVRLATSNVLECDTLAPQTPRTVISDPRQLAGTVVDAWQWARHLSEYDGVKAQEPPPEFWLTLCKSPTCIG